MADVGQIQHSDMTLEEGQQKWCPISEILVSIQANRKPRAFAKVKLLGLSAASTALMLVFGLWAAGLFEPKPSKPQVGPATAPATRETLPKGALAEPRQEKSVAENTSDRMRRFWRFAPEYGDGYFKQLPDGTWEERGKGDGALMGVWVERGRTAEYVELEDRKRGYLTRLGAGKAWIASIRDDKFAPSPHGNWENGHGGTRQTTELPSPDPSPEKRELHGWKRRLTELDKRLTKELAQINAGIEKKSKSIRELQKEAQRLDEAVEKEASKYADFSNKELMVLETELYKKGASFEEIKRKRDEWTKNRIKGMELLKKLQHEQMKARENLQVLERAITDLKSQAIEIQERANQEQRKIEEENRVWTKQELEKLESEHSTAEQAADNYIQGLINARRLEKATRIRTGPVQLTTGRFVEGSKKVDYRVRYVSEVGLVNEREGYVIVSGRVIAGRTFWFVSTVTALQGIHLP